MTSIWTEVESWFAPEEAAIAAFVKGAAADLTAWVKGEETIIVADAQAAWAKALPIITAIPPSQMAIIQGLVNTAATDAAEGDYTAIATDVLKQAAVAELAWVTALGQGLLNVIVAFLAYKPAPAA
jgi:hypothetical protein